MKGFILSVIKYGLLGLITCAVLIFGGFFYIKSNIKSADNKTEGIPYSFSAPENQGIMLNLEGKKIFLYLDFDNMSLKVIFPPEKIIDSVYGYPIDFYINADYGFLRELIDSAGGIELNLSGENLRYTGVQIVDILSRTTEKQALRENIINSILNKIGTDGIDGNFFKYITEKTETDITVPDSYYWEEYLSELCTGGVIINSNI